MRMVVMKKGGEPGDVAINPDLVTHVRSSGGPYTDVYFKDHKIAVELPFREVVNLLSGDYERTPERRSGGNWLKPS